VVVTDVLKLLADPLRPLTDFAPLLYPAHKIAMVLTNKAIRLEMWLANCIAMAEGSEW